MKIITLILLISSCVFSKVYYSKVEPYETRNISSSVSGVVLFVDEESLGKKLSKKPYIEIDSELDRAELGFTKSKIQYLEETLALNQKMLKNLQASLEKKRENYKQVEALKIKARVEKDKEFYDLVTSENSYLTTQKEIMSLKNQIADLKLRKAQLTRSVNDKTLSAKEFTLYSLEVKVGQVVAPSTPLAKLVDTSKALLTIYLDEEDLVGAKEKSIYIDGEKTPYKITRLLSIADSKNISKYMAQIVIKAPGVFSRLAKVELKDEKSAK